MTASRAHLDHPLSHRSRISAEEFLQLHLDRPCELIDGEILMMSPAGFEHGRRAYRIIKLLGDFVEAKNLGFLVGAETGFTLKRNPDTVRAPDAAFIRKDREPVDGDPFFEGAPDLAVEVVSPNDTKKDVEIKVTDWLNAGTRMVWIIWPATQSVTVHRPGEAKRILHGNDTIDGLDVLPGFTCPVARIFT